MTVVNYVQRSAFCSNHKVFAVSLCGAGGSGSEGLKKCPPPFTPPCSPAILE